MALAFEVDTSEQPAEHPPLTPGDGAVVAVNPPPMVWRVDDRAATYTVELARDAAFDGDVLRVDDIDMPFYNHTEVLEEGTWHWRYYAVTDEGQRSQPSEAKRFVVPGDAIQIPVPPTEQILRDMPDHPRIFTAPDELDAFRQRRHDVAAEAWKAVRSQAEQVIDRGPDELDLKPLDSHPPQGPTPGRGPWEEGDPTRRQVIWLVDDEPYIDPDYDYRALARAAGRANRLSFAYLISGESHYAEAARELVLFLADARLDYHLEREERASHDTVVYAYEQGLKFVALTYDRIYDHLSEQERRLILDHIEYHADNAYRWLHDVERIHLRFQISHPVQCMHALLPTVLAIANDSEPADQWADYLIRQYVNRIAFSSDDGGYFEGQTYAYKFRWVLESLVALQTAAGLDLFQKPRIANSGRFWLYAMSLNYWYHHGGDVFSLIRPWGNPSDSFISNLMASMTADPYVQWWSDTVYADPVHLPLQYLSATDLEPVPPIDIPQAELFPDTGQLSAYDRFYDHLSDRIFFRSSPWGGHSHAHADQNNFVIHAGGEILAADTGYYTYYGDDYHMDWAVTTNTHNSILIEQQVQPKGIEYKGSITEFFHSPVYTFFAGDGTQAYKEPMERFERAVLFIRPNVYVVYDELKADEPSEFNWLLNTFQDAKIDADRHRMVVPQQHMRLQVDHLLPRHLRYSQSNERRHPMWTRDWSRFNEAFPEPWHIRVSNTVRERDVRFLTVMNTFEAASGSTIETVATIDEEHTVGATLAVEDDTETVLFRRHLRDDASLEHDGIVADAIMASVGHSTDGGATRWVASHATRLSENGRVLFESEHHADVAGQLGGAAASGLFWIDADDEQAIELHVPQQVGRVLRAPPHEPTNAEPVDFQWQDDTLSVRWPGGKGVLWVDPTAELDNEPPTLTLRVEDSAGRYDLELPARMAEDGQWVAYAQPNIREQGRYVLRTDREAELLIQDRHDIRESARGRDEIAGPFRDGTELFIRFDPDDTPPRVRARLTESYQGRIINYVRNGTFEQGLPGYPPRGWTVLRDLFERDPGWAAWTQQEAYTGESSLKLIRPKAEVGARPQPMRLSTSGTYHLRFMAKGNATKATVRVNGAQQSGGRMVIEPSDGWQLHEMELEMSAGYCEIHFELGEGGSSDQVLWVDDLNFGPIGETPAAHR